MGRDWKSFIQEQGQVARIKGKVVAAILADPNAPMQTIGRLSRDVEEMARHFDRLFLEVSEELSYDDPLIDAAVAIEDMWSKMSVDLAYRLKPSTHLRIVLG
jgi:hypothetical protein